MRKEGEERPKLQESHWGGGWWGCCNLEDDDKKMKRSVIEAN